MISHQLTQLEWHFYSPVLKLCEQSCSIKNAYLRISKAYITEQKLNIFGFVEFVKHLWPQPVQRNDCVVLKNQIWRYE